MPYKDPLDPRAREARRKHYAANREQYYERNRKQRRAIRDYVRELKSVPCADCAQTYPYYVMDFDHRPGEIKLYEPARLIAQSTWKKVRDEVAKCDVVCANCHRIRTYSRSNNL